MLALSMYLLVFHIFLCNWTNKKNEIKFKKNHIALHSGNEKKGVEYNKYTVRIQSATI